MLWTRHVVHPPICLSYHIRYYTQDYTRVWLLCELKVSWALPTFIVDYAAKRAMPRATTWLKPQVEAAAELWLKERPVDDV